MVTGDQTAQPHLQGTQKVQLCWNEFRRREAGRKQRIQATGELRFCIRYDAGAFVLTRWQLHHPLGLVAGL
jgi:hypothetical protein